MRVDRQLRSWATGQVGAEVDWAVGQVGVGGLGSWAGWDIILA